MILDASAGNRMMWKNKRPPLTVFMDKRTDLNPPPDVVSAWEACPFRDDVFGSVIFDPPHIVRSGGADPRFDMHQIYGAWGSKREVVIAIIKAQREFTRVAKRLCFKWCETRDGPTLWNLLPLFSEWRKIYAKEKETRGRGNIRGTTYWVTFARGGNAMEAS